ncbi:hypothetical protein F5148DRAFT_1283209 [Russula earlei]|uniref:Uncharacterized protein n=1 Tax=Russula earlei TaxID=71964 RepID=A0ACC0UC72_9AGAM|nr:hypothetical protein F5148DRAFT_1283209 [Russula earlei]
MARSARLHSFLWLLRFLAVAPQGALSVFQFVSYSLVKQCGPFNVSFYGGQPPTELPLTLIVIPFNSTPLSFTIPESAWDNSTSSGSYVTLLPLPAGIHIMASLDDAAGNNAALTSDVIQIQPSKNASCIPTNMTARVPFQLVDNAVSQCLPFNISRNASTDDALSTRVFIPTGLSFSLGWTAFHTNQGIDTFTYIMAVAQGLRVALLLEDRQGDRQVSDLLTVKGEQSSPSGCLCTGSSSYTTTTVTPVGSQRGSSKSALIAISITSPIAVLIIVILGIVLIRRERRKLVGRLIAGDQGGETDSPSPPFGPPVPPKPAQLPAEIPSTPVPVDPVYPAELFMIPPAGSRVHRSSRATVLAPSAPSLKSAKSLSSMSPSVSTRTTDKRSAAKLRPLEDLDIAGLLEVASQQPAATEAPRGYPAASPHTVTPVLTPTATSSPSVSLHRTSSPPTIRELTPPEPDVPLTPLRRLSQEWLNPQPPLATVTIASPRNGLPLRIRPLPVPIPSRGTGGPGPGQTLARF